MSHLLFDAGYVALYSDGSVGVSDGMGYVGELDPEDIKGLYEALHNYYKTNTQEPCKN